MRQTAPLPQTLRIGEVARRTGLAISTLRFYEKVGLLDHPDRTAAGYRLYGEDVLERVEFIRRAQALGFTLDDIRSIVSERASGRAPCDMVRRLVHSRLADVERHIAELQRYRDDLVATLADWEAHPPPEGHICGLIEQGVTS